MSEAQRAWTCAVEGRAPDSAAGEHDARDWQERHEGQNSNELASQTLAMTVIGRRLTRDELSVAARVLHYGFGAVVGGVYGMWVERRHRVRRRTGLALGTTLWLTADEIAMPLLGLSQPTTRRPFEMHLQSLVAHLVYGMTAEMTRCSIRRAV